MLERLHFDQLFMGASAIADDGMICSVDVSEASLNGKMLARSRQKVLMADSSKFGAVATYAVAPIGTASVVICDAGLDPRWQQTLAQSGVDLLLATPSTEPDAGLRDESELA